MDRFHHLHSVVRRESAGIEIGPWRHPVAPKRDGYRTTVIDILDTEALRAMARDRNVPAEEISLIEDVDIVGDGSQLLSLVRGRGCTERFGWIVSCHNFEHLPDPVRFLRDCEQLLEPGGAVAMIVPDKRFSIDRFQPSATLADMLRVWISGPAHDDAAWDRFRQNAMKSHLVDAAGKRRLVWSNRDNDPAAILADDPRQAFAQLRAELASSTPPDGFRGHRWRFTPAVFEAILFDLRILGLVGLEVEAVTPTGGEFSVRLRATPPAEISGEEIRVRRTALFLRADDEAAAVSRAYRHLEAELAATRAELDRVALRAA